jgi:hypothetical protein
VSDGGREWMLVKSWCFLTETNRLWMGVGEEGGGRAETEKRGKERERMVRDGRRRREERREMEGCEMEGGEERKGEGWKDA